MYNRPGRAARGDSHAWCGLAPHHLHGGGCYRLPYHRVRSLSKPHTINIALPFQNVCVGCSRIPAPLVLGVPTKTRLESSILLLCRV